MYATSVAGGVSSVSVTATVAQPSRVTLRIAGVVRTSGSATTVPLTGAVTTIQVRVDAESGASTTYTITVTRLPVQQAYVKASNTGAGDNFGFVALSADGNTMAVGSPYEDSNAVGVNGNQNNEARENSGAVYVFIRSGATWTQQAYLKASNPDPQDDFGLVVALSGDGNTLAVGAPWEDSGSAGVNGNQQDNTRPASGAVYVFTRNGANWSQDAYLKASTVRANLGFSSTRFGHRVSLSHDGRTLAVSAPGEDSSATGVNGDQANSGAEDSGAAYVFVRGALSWSQQAYLKASNTGRRDAFGDSVALSGDGNTLCVGAPFEESSATTVNGDQTDNSLTSAGAAYVFVRAGTNWSQQAYLKASNAGFDSRFGSEVAVSGDGNTVAVSAPNEESGATGVNGNQYQGTVTMAGAVYVFFRTGTTWAQQAYVKASNTGSEDEFGWSVALSRDGQTLLVGAVGESSSASGINGNQAINTTPAAGAAYLFTRTATAWRQDAYVKASNPDAQDIFGHRCALNQDGTTFVIGAIHESSAATGIDGNQVDDSSSSAGAVYVFVR